MQPSKRTFMTLIAGAAAAALLPIRIGQGTVFASIDAFAKNGGGNGNGNGGGNGTGNSGGNGNGNGGNSNGNGNSGGDGNSGGNGNGKGSSGDDSRSSHEDNSADAPASSAADPNPAAASGGGDVRATKNADGSIEVRHRTGITETIVGGKYVIRDAKGRTINSRPATQSDARRLNKYLR